MGMEDKQQEEYHKWKNYLKTESLSKLEKLDIDRLVYCYKAHQKWCL